GVGGGFFCHKPADPEKEIPGSGNYSPGRKEGSYGTGKNRTEKNRIHTENYFCVRRRRGKQRHGSCYPENASAAAGNRGDHGGSLRVGYAAGRGGSDRVPEGNPQASA